MNDLKKKRNGVSECGMMFQLKKAVLDKVLSVEDSIFQRPNLANFIDSNIITVFSFTLKRNRMEVLKEYRPAAYDYLLVTTKRNDLSLKELEKVTACIVDKKAHPCSFDMGAVPALEEDEISVLALRCVGNKRVGYSGEPLKEISFAEYLTRTGKSLVKGHSGDKARVDKGYELIHRACGLGSIEAMTFLAKETIKGRYSGIDKEMAICYLKTAVRASDSSDCRWSASAMSFVMREGLITEVFGR